MKTDYDLFAQATANQFRAHDNAVLNNPDTISHFVEELILPSGDAIEQISVKRALLNDKLEPVGVFGCSLNINKFMQPDKSLQDIIKENAIARLQRLIFQFMGAQTSKLIDEIIEALFYLIPLYPKTSELRKLLLLTSREFQCLCLLLKSHSSKQIALLLNVSHRTIEIYIAHIKEKLNLPFKLQTTDWFWNLLSHL